MEINKKAVVFAKLLICSYDLGFCCEKQIIHPGDVVAIFYNDVLKPTSCQRNALLQIAHENIRRNTLKEDLLVSIATYFYKRVSIKLRHQALTSLLRCYIPTNKRTSSPDATNLIMNIVEGRMVEITCGMNTRICQLACLLNPHLLIGAPLEMKDYDAVVMSAIGKNKYAFQYASKRFQDCSEIVMQAVETFPSAFEYASDRLRDNEEIVMKAIALDGSTLFYASERLQDSSEIVMLAVESFPSALEGASDRLRDNEEIVMKAIALDGSTLLYASERLQDSREFVMLAIETYPMAIRFASDRLRDNEEIVMKAVALLPSTLLFASERLQDSREFVMMAVALNGSTNIDRIK